MEVCEDGKCGRVQRWKMEDAKMRRSERWKMDGRWKCRWKRMMKMEDGRSRRRKIESVQELSEEWETTLKPVRLYSRARVA